MQPVPVIVKRYPSERAYQKDAQVLAGQGYRVTNVASEQPRSSCLRIILLGGIGALIWKPKPVLVVTYQLG